MELVQLMPILGSVLSGVAVLVSYLNLSEATKAESEQIKKLNAELAKRLTDVEKMKLIHMRNSLVHGLDVDDKELEQARKLLISIIQDLHDSDLERVSSRLNQSSEVGKIRYTDKVISLTDLEAKET
ncbi:hypothetical protein [Vibrio parahaemolyticus]|uniref:hypothetical protein n=1 Tax=Vibrio parahaemolyticus TaxID=670 RepID=UPI00186A105F|nr:hypothetical protein [Vibrio parahaemolyticus]MBE3682330.1 hypothetical protein [Vibrio parahaemolyticus]MBE4171375.1 hypothetical protein [Vibrio parahaemolyticus]MBM5064225.1 hypothetical protein [Vibrio parahaemolyticus]MCR9756948.1 hypothetical protein [Vibrio parahaemolyticus]MDS1993141.1 hypothetical protein [Vibrio parahaemolyticus]